MNIKETLEAWLRPKDLSLVLEIEGPLVENGSSFLSAMFGKYYELLKPKYAGRYVILVTGNQTSDGKNRFYVEPAIRGRKDNITWEEFRNLYSKGSFYYYLESKMERATPRCLAGASISQ